MNVMPHQAQVGRQQPTPQSQRPIFGSVTGRRRWRAARPAAWLVLCVALTAGNGAFAQQASPDRGPQPATPQPAAAPGGQPVEPGQEQTLIENPMTILEALRPYFSGGFIIAFFLCSVIAVWFAIERIVVLRKGRVIPRPFVERFLHLLGRGELDRDEALKLCEENESPIAAIFAHGVRKWGKPSVEVEQAIIDGGERQVSQLRKHLRVLNGVATVSPLIGLLGTVIGMILSFNQIATAGAMGNAQQLADGIAMALLTTAAGLMIAIPTLITYTYLSGRVDGLVMEMDLLAQDVVHLISAEALANPPVQTMHAHRTPRSAAKTAKTKRAV